MRIFFGIAGGDHSRQKHKEDKWQKSKVRQNVESFHIAHPEPAEEFFQVGKKMKFCLEPCATEYGFECDKSQKDRNGIPFPWIAQIITGEYSPMIS